MDHGVMDREEGEWETKEEERKKKRFCRKTNEGYSNRGLGKNNKTNNNKQWEVNKNFKNRK